MGLNSPCVPLNFVSLIPKNDLFSRNAEEHSKPGLLFEEWPNSILTLTNIYFFGLSWFNTLFICYVVSFKMNIQFLLCFTGSLYRVLLLCKFYGRLTHSAGLYWFEHLGKLISKSISIRSWSFKFAHTIISVTSLIWIKFTCSFMEEPIFDGPR